jgi:hypothetical protein
MPVTVTYQIWIDNPNSGLELIRGNYAGSEFSLIIVHLDRNPARQIIVHKEPTRIDIIDAMKHANAIVAALGTFNDPQDLPIGDLVLNGVSEQYVCPVKRFYAVRDTKNCFDLALMKKVTWVTRRGKRVTSFNIPQRVRNNAKYAIGGLFALIVKGKPVQFADMGDATGNFKQQELAYAHSRVAYGFSKNHGKFFIAANRRPNRSAPQWTIIQARDFLRLELPTIQSLTGLKYSAYGAFAGDAGSGTHLYIKRGSGYDKENVNAGGASIEKTRKNITWVMVR